MPSTNFTVRTTTINQQSFIVILERAFCGSVINDTAGFGLATSDFGPRPLGAQPADAVVSDEQEALPPPRILSAADDISQGPRRRQDELGQPATEADPDAGRQHLVQELGGKRLFRRRRPPLVAR